METQEVVVEGTLRADGRLELDEKPDLPPGPVRVMVRSISSAQEVEHTWEVLQRIWAARKARGEPVRSAAEIDASIAAMREEDEARAQRIERLQAEAQAARSQR